MTARPRARRALAGVAVTLVVAFGALACSEPETGRHDVRLPAKDRSRMVMPTDAFVETETGNRDYARDLAIGTCMKAAGQKWSVAPRTVRPDGNASWNSVTRLIFTPETARTFGYHQQIGEGGLDQRKIDELFRQPRLDRAGEKAWTACAERADRRLGLDKPISHFATKLAAEAYARARADHGVVAAAGRWADCMAPLGIADLGSDPADMPTPSLRAMFGLDADAPPTEKASADEIRIATADAGCQESSGYAEAIYDTEWDIQAKLVEKYADRLVKIRARLDAQHRRIHAYLKQRGVIRAAPSITREADTPAQTSGLP